MGTGWLQSPTPRSHGVRMSLDVNTLVIVFKKLSSANKERNKIQRTFSQARIKPKPHKQQEHFSFYCPLILVSGFKICPTGVAERAMKIKRGEMNWNWWWEFLAKSFISGLPRKICQIGILWHPLILFVFVTSTQSNSEISNQEPTGNKQISRYYDFGSLGARQINI